MQQEGMENLTEEQKQPFHEFQKQDVLRHQKES